MNTTSLIDPLNLKSFIIQTIGFVKTNNNSSDLRTILNFLEHLFENIKLCDNGGTCIRSSKIIIDIQKLFSGNIRPHKINYLVRPILSNNIDDSLRKNLGYIVDQICSSENSDEFWRELNTLLSKRFFTPQEIAYLIQLIEQKKRDSYIACILSLIKHGFGTLENIPCFAAERLYEEAQTYDFDHPTRFELLKIAADNGHKRAALEYGNYINRTRPDGTVPPSDADIAFRYTVKALPLASAIWNLSFQLECLQLTDEQVNILTNAIKLDEKLTSEELAAHLDELKLVKCNIVDSRIRVAYETAYKINFYLGYSGFPKGFNSVAKFLQNKKFGFYMIPNESFCNIEDLSEYYYQKAISAGCVPSVQNAGIAQYKKIKVAPNQYEKEDYEYTEELLRTAANCGMTRSLEILGCYYLDILHDEKRAKNCFNSVLNKCESGISLYKLGILESSWSQKSDYFRKAINAGYYDAVYPYVVAESELFELDHDKLHIFRALNIIEQHVNRMDDLTKKRLQLYAQALRSTVNHETIDN